MHKEILIVFIIFLVNSSHAKNFRDHVNWPKDVDDVCGESYADRIVGGEIAKLGQYPWMAQLELVQTTEFGNIYVIGCGGVLISRWHVISAAHCIDIKNTRIDTVILGEYDTRTDPDCEDNVCAEPKQLIKPEAVYKPKKYNSRTFRHDIILIKLQHEAQLNGWVTPICLPSGQETFGKSTEVAGWGLSNSSDTKSIQKVLNFVKLPILKTEECKKHLSIPIKENFQICAGSITRKIDTCSGDSGGPLMQVANTESGPKYFLVGIVSYGRTTCGIAPAIYTRVLHYMKFILNKMKIN